MMWPFHKRGRYRGESPAGSLRPCPEVKVSLHSDGVAFLHVAAGQVLSANRVGARMWQKMADGMSVDQIAGEISREFEAPIDVVRQDAERFLQELTGAGILIPHATPDGAR